MEKQKKQSIEKQLEDIAGYVCDNLCKYRETSDDECICDYIREHDECPLDPLF